ncbi:hemerythrin domain-containing protein [Pseudomonas sp. F1_0610]|uniref:bacteriohemerythrin n=1 Tax=Pseudomonas sp. F1_0610 TaxID=3114284 RepID=UPI0039C211D3
MSNINLEWSSSFATGIDLIDRQHQLLFEFFHELGHLIADKRDADFEIILQGVIQYATNVHLYEDDLLRRSGYPFWAKHQDSHETFRQQLDHYFVRLEQGEDALRLARSLRTDVGNWALEHIRKEDQHYAQIVVKSLRRGMLDKVMDKVRSITPKLKTQK